jgi:hypothetical protein
LVDNGSAGVVINRGRRWFRGWSRNIVKLVQGGRWRRINMVGVAVSEVLLVETGTWHEENETEEMRGWLAGVGSPGHRQSNP